MIATGERVPTVREVEAEAARWPEQYLECRLYGHSWRPQRATHYRSRYFYVVQSCPRCTTERHSEISERGAILASWLKYPPDYLTKGIGRIIGEGRDVLRLSALQRVYDVTTTRQTATPHSAATRRALGMED